MRSGTEALKPIDLDIRRGEIFALLGPNGAGKTTMISIICGIVTPTAGEVLIDGKNWQRNYREARKRIGLVPQELTMDVFEPLMSTVSFSRELFGRRPIRREIEEILRELSLWDKRKTILKELSGGMKRRVMIAKALAHDPDILFLDEPTAGVDVELRRDMWNMVRRLRENGTTIILTTHYIEEAEEMADRVGVINKGELILVEEKNELMKKLGRKVLHLQLAEPLAAIPPALAEWNLELSDDGGHADLRVRRQGRPHRRSLAARRDARRRHRLQGPRHAPVEPGGHFRRPDPPQEGRGMNLRGIWAIYKFEMHRFARTLWTGLAVPVITTSLYFVVFGVGDRLADERDRRHRLRQLHRARPDDAVAVHARASSTRASASTCRASPAPSTRSCRRPCRRSRRCSAMSARRRPRRSTVALVIFVTANLFVDVRIEHPLLMLLFLLLVARTFCLFGFIVGIWAKGFEQLQIIPLLIVTPLTFLGGAFYSIDMLARAVADHHPVQSGRLSDQRLPLDLLRHRGRALSASAWRRRSPSSWSACTA